MSHAVLSVNGRARQWLDERAALDAADAPDQDGSGADSGSTGPGLGFTLPTVTRRHVAFAAGALLAAWIALVIGRAVVDSAAVNDRAAQLRVENAQLEQRLEASRREVELVRSEAYVRLEARAYGYGRNGERAFSLDPGAPPPPRIRLLGTDPADEAPRPPLEEWLELLFGG